MSARTSGEQAFADLRLKALGIWDRQYPLAELTASLREAKEGKR